MSLCAELAQLEIVESPELNPQDMSSRVVARDGVPLRIFEGGSPDAPPVLLCMPHATPIGVYHRLIEALIQRFRVVTWETRGYPVVNEGFDDLDVGIEAHVGDAAFVMEACGLEEADAIGICSGAAIVSWLSAQGRARIRRAVLVNGNLNLAALHPNTEFKTGMLSLLESLATSRDRARNYAMAFKSGAFSAGGVDLFEGAFRADEVRDLQLRAFRDGETAFRYARMDVEVCETDSMAILPKVRAKTLLVGFLDNNVIPWEWTVEAMKLVPDAQARLYPTGGHYAVCKRLDVIEDVMAFLGT